MQATFQSATRVMLLGIAMVCVAIGCADNNPQAKKPATTGPAVVSKAPSKDEPQVAKATEDADEAKEIAATRAKLSPEDRKLVEAQEWCVVNNDERLGGMMGAPVKLTIKGETVFLCCKSCKKEAEANPDKTLAKLTELKAKKKAESEKK